MAAPSYALTNYSGTAQPADDILQLIENQLALTEWVFVEQVAFVQASTNRVMRVWKCPSTLNTSGTDFYIGLIKNAAVGTYLSVRVFESWNTTTKVISRPVLPGASALNQAWNTVAYGNGQFMAVGSGTNYGATSPDGITWTARLLPTTTTWFGAAYGAGLWVILGAGSIYATSPDGITWTQRVLPTSANWRSLIFANGQFLAGSTTTSALTSPDGLTWTTRTANRATIAIAYGNGLFVTQESATTSTTGSHTTNGTTWTDHSMGLSNTWTGVTYGNSLFVAVGNVSTSFSTSPDGLTWTARTGAATSTCVAYGNGTFVAMGTTGTTAVTSTDGISWTSRPLTPAAASSGTPWSAITYGGTLFSTVNTNSTTNVLATAAASSPDGVTWTQRSLGKLTHVALDTYLTTGATTPVMCEPQPTLVASTNYDVAVLVSRSYLVVGVNQNGSGTPIFGWVLGLYSPAYSDSISTNPPLMCLSLSDATNSANGGVSRAMRVPVDSPVNASAFSITAGPESLLLGSFTNSSGTGLREPVTNSIRGSRAALIAAPQSGIAAAANQGPGFGFSAYGGFRGWLSDAIVVGTGPYPTYTVNTAKLGDTVTIGAATWTALGFMSYTSITTGQPSWVGFFFNTATGS